MIHAVDYTVWVAGGEPQEIYGICGSDADIGFKSPDNAEILFRTDKGVTCSVNLAFYQTPGHNDRLFMELKVRVNCAIHTAAIISAFIHDPTVVGRSAWMVCLET